MFPYFPRGSATRYEESRRDPECFVARAANSTYHGLLYDVMLAIDRPADRAESIVRSRDRSAPPRRLDHHATFGRTSPQLPFGTPHTLHVLCTFHAASTAPSTAHVTPYLLPPTEHIGTPSLSRHTLYIQIGFSQSEYSIRNCALESWTRYGVISMFNRDPTFPGKQ